MKAVITDLDRTLLHTDKSVSEYTYRVLERCREREILLMAATARPQRAVLPYQDKVGFYAMTTLNGAKVIMPRNVIENCIVPSSAEEILGRVSAIPGLILSMETEAGIFSSHPIPEWNASVYQGFPKAPEGCAVYKLLLGGSGMKYQREVEKALTADTYMTVAAGRLIQIMSTAATKWNGVRAMLEDAGISPEEAVYFGDDNDDVESIQNCGTGVAMSNGIRQVLEAADYVTESNDMDGVAGYIEKYLL